MTLHGPHRRAVHQTVQRAAASAEACDFGDAIACLDTLETVDGGLDDELAELRRTWQRAIDRSAGGTAPAAERGL